jgi:hypothetical protein
MSGASRSPYTSRLENRASRSRVGRYRAAATPAAIIDRASSERSDFVGTRPRPSTMTRYTATTTPLSPASETVWARRRSMRPSSLFDDPTTRATGIGRVAAAATAPTCGGHAVSRRRARTITTTSAPTATAQPNHCMRWRSTPVERRYLWLDPMTPTRAATTARTMTGHNGSDGRWLHSTMPTATPAG